MSYNPDQSNPSEDPFNPPNSGDYSAGDPGNASHNPSLELPPMPLGETLWQLPRQYWRILLHPGATTFIEEQAWASWGAVWVQLIGYSIVVAIFSALFQRSNVLISFVSVFVGPFIVTGIYWLITRAFRGRGSFLQYMYCYLLFIVPINIISPFLFLIPGIGSLLALMLGIYELVLLIIMTVAVHRISGGKATLNFIILLIVLCDLAEILVTFALPFLLRAV